jgi:hypothetical protein
MVADGGYGRVVGGGGGSGGETSLVCITKSFVDVPCVDVLLILFVCNSGDSATRALLAHLKQIGRCTGT